MKPLLYLLLLVVCSLATRSTWAQSNSPALTPEATFLENYNMTFVGDSRHEGIVDLCSFGFGDKADPTPLIHFSFDKNERVEMPWQAFSLKPDGSFQSTQNGVQFRLDVYSDLSPKRFVVLELAPNTPVKICNF